MIYTIIFVRILDSRLNDCGNDCAWDCAYKTTINQAMNAEYVSIQKSVEPLLQNNLFLYDFVAEEIIY